MAGISPPIVAIVAKAPRAGAVKTRLCPPLTPEEAYFARLAPSFLRVAQQGRDLGARMAHAFDALFASGAPAVVAIGTDVPALPAAFVADALRRLAHGETDVVLLPTDDGGYGLIGLTRPHPALFDGIAWSTATVLGDTLARADAAGLSVALLPPWFDVDTPADLARLDAMLGAAAPDAPPAVAPRTRALLRARDGARA